MARPGDAPGEEVLLKSMASPFTLSSFPRAILHLDGDAFFTSVEQSIHPALKGRPVVTGKERGIIACASYEAKALGIRRGVGLGEARRLCPRLVVLPSDYEVYSLFSKRLFDIMRRYTPLVEEHSIDEGFADISGLRRMFHASYEEMARRMQADIHAELDLTVSVGLSVSKSLAKLASKFRKPCGFTAVAGRHIHLFLQRLPLESVWGFGPNTVHLLRKYGLKTAYDFAQRPEPWVNKLLGKVGREIRAELRGEMVWPVETEEKSTYATVHKCKTFTAPSADRDFIYAKLVRNVESAFIKLRRHRLCAREMTVFMRHLDFRQEGLTAALSRPTALPQEALPIVRALFAALYCKGAVYRATAVVLGKLKPDGGRQYELFEDPVRIDALERATRAADRINEQFGKHKLSLGTALHLPSAPRTDRDDAPWRRKNLLPGETARKRIKLPRLNMVV